MKSDDVFPFDNHCYIYTVFSRNFHTIYTHKQKRYRNMRNNDEMEQQQSIDKAILDVISISNSISKKIIKIICGLRCYFIL